MHLHARAEEFRSPAISAVPLPHIEAATKVAALGVRCRSVLSMTFLLDGEARVTDGSDECKRLVTIFDSLI
jgi:hypothetical protein